MERKGGKSFVCIYEDFSGIENIFTLFTKDVIIHIAFLYLSDHRLRRRNAYHLSDIDSFIEKR